MRSKSSKKQFSSRSEGHFRVGQTERHFRIGMQSIWEVFFCGPFAFWEFMSFFKSKVFRGSHTHQWMRLEKLVRKKEVSARDVESEIKIFQKTCSDPVRRPFSSWSDRRPFSIWKGRRPFSSWTDRSLKSSQMFLKPSGNFLKCP